MLVIFFVPHVNQMCEKPLVGCCQKKQKAADQKLLVSEQRINSIQEYLGAGALFTQMDWL